MSPDCHLPVCDTHTLGLVPSTQCAVLTFFAHTQISANFYISTLTILRRKTNQGRKTIQRGKMFLRRRKSQPWNCFVYIFSVVYRLLLPLLNCYTQHCYH